MPAPDLSACDRVEPLVDDRVEPTAALLHVNLHRCLRSSGFRRSEPGGTIDRRNPKAPLLEVTGAAPASSVVVGGGAAGTVVVFEGWAFGADQETWMASKLGPALTEVGVPEPKRMEWLEMLAKFKP
jgi:hypothetical protein